LIIAVGKSHSTTKKVERERETERERQRERERERERERDRQTQTERDLTLVNLSPEYLTYFRYSTNNCIYSRLMT
jgi:hypothetical protein